MPAPQQRWVPHRVPHPLQLYRKGWVIERTGDPGERFCSLGWRSETVVPLDAAETAKVEVKH
jgi:hypothetical protein